MNADTKLLLERAVSAENPVGALTAIAANMRDNGANQQQVYDVFMEFMLVLRAENRQSEEDSVGDVLDYIWGWCGPDHRIFRPKQS